VTQGQYSLPRLMLTKGTSRDRTPHPGKARNSRSTKRGTSCSADRCAARNVSNSEATTLYRRGRVDELSDRGWDDVPGEKTDKPRIERI
jgi:hypothetical protein